VLIVRESQAQLGAMRGHLRRGPYPSLDSPYPIPSTQCTGNDGTGVDGHWSTGEGSLVGFAEHQGLVCRVATMGARELA
jgi:hypothetical protein